MRGEGDREGDDGGEWERGEGGNGFPMWTEADTIKRLTRQSSNHCAQNTAVTPTTQSFPTT